MNTVCMIRELKYDWDVMEEFDRLYLNVWPEVVDSYKEAGIQSLQIHRAENRLIMVMQVDDDFSFERKEELEKQNVHVQAWEKKLDDLMHPMPNGYPDEKWRLTFKIFDTEERI